MQRIALVAFLSFATLICEAKSSQIEGEKLAALKALVKKSLNASELRCLATAKEKQTIKLKLLERTIQKAQKASVEKTNASFTYKVSLANTIHLDVALSNDKNKVTSITARLIKTWQQIKNAGSDTNPNFRTLNSVAQVAKVICMQDKADKSREP